MEEWMIGRVHPSILPPFHQNSSRMAMPQMSAGLLMYRKSGKLLEVFLVHPGGPFWARKDIGAWSIPKGIIAEGEDKLEAAKREFTEETSIIPSEPFIDLGEIRQKSGKRVHAWAFERNGDPPQITSNTFAIEWPPKSGRFNEFPEIDQGKFFPIPEAHQKINQHQAEFLSRLAKYFS
jgi:predicted NUDIX family NTP pyrophosphohydrolase